MLPVANLHIKNLYDSTVEFFAPRSTALPSDGVPPTDDTAPASSSARPLTPVPDPIAKLTRECSTLREKLDVAERRRQNECAGRSAAQPMRRELEATKGELARSQAEVARLEERCKMLEKTVRETKEMLRNLDGEVDRLRRERSRPLVTRRSDVEQKMHAQPAPKDDQSQKSESIGIPRSRGERRSLEEISVAGSWDEERAQARSLEAFMTKTDSWSGAQVIQAVHDLNSETLQFAASATELCTFTPRLSPSRPTLAANETVARLGPQLARALSSRDHAQDPILVQLAIQGCISSCIARALSTFCMGFQTKVDSVLSQVYARMYVAEPQPTSSKWRALTHKHIHTLHPTLGDYAINDLAETILRWSSDIFKLAGCTSFEGSPSVREGLRARFGEQVRRIARSVCKLAQVTREEIMSTCFDVVAAEHGEMFDGRVMYDAFGEYVATSRGPILCTSELGLRCTTRKSAGEEQEGGAIERQLLLQPKVVLESMLEVLDPR